MLAVVRMPVGSASAKQRWIMPVASLNPSSDQIQETRVLDIEWVFFSHLRELHETKTVPCDKQSVWEIITL